MTTDISLIDITIIMSVVAILIVIVYFKSKIFHSYPYYFNIYFILTILLNNLIRLIPKREEENEYEISIQCYIQGIVLTVLDKLMLCQITSYSVIYYLGSFHNDFFKKNEMIIFFLLSQISFVISMVLAVVFSAKGMSVGSQYCYVRTRDETKYIVDTIITTMLWAISELCTIRLLINLVKLKKEAAVYNRKAKSISYHTFRFSFNLVFNVLMFLYVDLIINKVLNNVIPDFTKDMYYILLSLVGEIFFTINTEVMKEAKRMITCQSSNEEEDEESKTFYKDNENDNEKEMNDK